MRGIRNSGRIAITVLIFTSGVLLTATACNIGPGNLGFGNVGVGNVGLFNWGLGNTGVSNRGVLNAGAENTGVATFGLRNVGVANFLPFPNTVSVANIPVAPNLGLLNGRRRRRRGTSIRYSNNMI